jgi:hypothetical protein
MMALSRRVVGYGATLSVFCAMVAGCHSDDVDRSAGPLSEMHYQWTASPGIDLVTGPAVPIRAYMESRLTAHLSGKADAVYPGFERAVSARSDDGSPAFLTSNLRPDQDSDPAVTPAPVGDNRLRLQALHETGSNVTAVVCIYQYGLAVQQGNGSYRSVVSGYTDKGISAQLMTLAGPPAATADTEQSGPASAPADDVFGDWKITGFLNGVRIHEPDFDQVWPTFDADTAECVDQAPDTPARRSFLIGGEHPRTGFPTSPPSPGWPAEQR